MKNKRVNEWYGYKYKNGYWDKITYWINQLQQASYDNNLREVDHCHRKLDYFIGRQWDLDNQQNFHNPNVVTEARPNS